MKFDSSIRSAIRVCCIAAASAMAALAQPEPPAPPVPPNVRVVMDAIGGGSRSYLGVGVREIDEERAKALKLKSEYGVEITNVDEESPAAKAGLKEGDVVQEYNGQRVEGMEQFIRLVRETPIGRNVNMKLVRGGNSQNVAVAIGQRKNQFPRVFASGAMPIEMGARSFRIEMPEIPSPVMSWRTPRLGIEAEELQGQLAEFFGAKNGVLVRSVGKESAAAKAGLKAGDVILKVGDTAVESPRDIGLSLRKLAAGKQQVSLRVLRNKQEQNLEVTLEIEEQEAVPAKGPKPAVRPSAKTANNFMNFEF